MRALPSIFTLVANGVCRQTEGFRRRADGSWFFSRDRGPGWHRHGTTPITLTDLANSELVPVVVHKQRWIHVTSRRTEHDRPPDQVGWRRFTALVLIVGLAGWLLSDQGVHTHKPLVAGLHTRPSARTLQRWRANAASHAGDLAQAVRLAWFKLKPRQAGVDVPGGIPPPKRGPWRGQDEVEGLRSALSMVLNCSVALNCSSASLLAEVRRRHPNRPFITD